MAKTAWATMYVPTAVTMPWLSGVPVRCTQAAQPAPSDEPEHGAEAQPDRERAGVAAVGRPAGGDRERHGEHQGDAAAGADRVPVPPHRSWRGPR